MINKKSKIYIAGHNGMVGSAITRKLREKGYKNLLTVNRKKLDLLIASRYHKKSKIINWGLSRRIFSKYAPVHYFTVFGVSAGN